MAAEPIGERSCVVRRVRRALLAAFAAVVLAGGCAQQAPRPADAPVPTAPPAAADGAVLVRDASYVVVVAQTGDTLAGLAERWLGAASQRGAIAELNGIEEVRAGQAVAIPLGTRNAVGVRPGAAQARPARRPGAAPAARNLRRARRMRPPRRCE